MPKSPNKKAPPLASSPPSPSSPLGARGSAARPLAALLLLGLALAAWAWIGSCWLRGGPVRQHLSAGIALANQGQGPQAEAEWREALRLDPNDKHFHTPDCNTYQYASRIRSMDKNISGPWAVVAVVVVLLIVGAAVWKAMAPKAPVAASAPMPDAPGGHPGYPPPTRLSAGGR